MRFLRKIWLRFRIWLLKWEVILEGPPYSLTERELRLIDELEES